MGAWTELESMKRRRRLELPDGTWRYRINEAWNDQDEQSCAHVHVELWNAAGHKLPTIRLRPFSLVTPGWLRKRIEEMYP